ncbi:SDR family NAD(P)-dependent oxidoreductase [Cytobacillus horneckiae]|uniref:SDR family NAD(P)-dependent oxidoreductase n=1 Tax=Cytobacillus horneckiae TaxID=549687 RepID=UPI000A5298FE|nr:SDR family NAD(P)-dependent oxidoreductase [Cytobacillus horneckiae]MCM3177434.1 SDR family oxidoreductase [Cytobacillus horneckiae]MEC1156003.1 SDR family NAD(P)-dependent oxidoreductase [Cytobacillus horneckiae]MED2939721.1 SDR family NAD(P)-dependent oxidoreductase [Cytobacillus horneckiae]
MINLDGKTVVVTGGASGIGLATVNAFIDKGSKVVLADFNEQAGKTIEQQFKNEGKEVKFVKVDVSDEQSIKNMVAETVNAFGQIDILVNNAGFGSMSPTHERSYEDYLKIVNVNQGGVFLGSKYAITEMLKTGGGSIINTASILGYVAQAGALPYNAAKGAVVTMTKSLAVEYADKNIRVNAVAPGFIESGAVNKEALGDFYDGLVDKHPIGRLGRPEEIAHAIIFLAENEFITGTTVTVDGGYTAI